MGSALKDLEEYKKLISRTPEDIAEERRLINEEKLRKKEEARQRVKDFRAKQSLERKLTGVRRKYIKTIPDKYKTYIQRANKKKLKFELSLVDFEYLLSRPCRYCGSYSEMTIDRIDSSEGYIEGNVASVCFTCNIMKYTLSHENFLKHIVRIYNHLR